MRRKPLSKRVRFEVFKRDHFTCTYCGQKPPDVMLHVDHIVAVIEGGSDEADNLVTSCSSCNLGKGATSLGTAVPQVPEEVRLEAIQESLERAALLAEQQVAAAALREAEEAVAIQVEDYWAECFNYREGNQIYWPNWTSTLQFVRCGLSVNQIMDAVRKTSEVKQGTDWRAPRYFYGICWSMIRDLDDTGGDHG